MKNAFSIVVPCYNAETYIDRCLKSIAKQTYTNYEILIIDDGSKDNTINIIKKNEKFFDNCKVITKKNEGVSSARNIGINNAINEFIIFIDSDDWVDSSYLQIVNEKINSLDCDLIVMDYYKETHRRSDKILQGKFEVIKDRLRFLQRSEGSRIQKNTEILKHLKSFMNLYDMNVIWNKIYKREIIVKGNIEFLESQKIGEDLIFNLEYISCSENTLLLEEKFYHYQLLTNSSTKKFDKDKYLSQIYIMIDQLNRISGKTISNFESVIVNQILIMLFGFYRSVYITANGYSEFIIYTKSKNIREVIRLIPISCMTLKERLYYFIIKFPIFMYLLCKCNLIKS